jgi:hypothetical protein
MTVEPRRTLALPRLGTMLLLAVVIAVPLRAQDEPATTGSTAALARDNVVILLDASGSMDYSMSGSSQSRMEVAKEALAKVVDRIDPNANVGLLVFSDISDANGWLYDLAPFDRERLLEAIDRCQASGGTPLGTYLKMAADRLIEVRQAQRGYGTFRLLVVTDGEANDADLLRRYLPDVLTRGVTVDCIGVDMDQDHALARQVRSYRRANDPAALEAAVAQSLGEVGGADVNDDATAEQYELAAALTEETASAVLDQLTTPLNAPIGDGPASSAPLESDPDSSGEYYGQADGAGGGFVNALGGICTCLFVIVVLFLVAVAAVARVAGKKRRR